MEPATLAYSRLKRRRFDECIQTCTELLQKNPLDQAVWYIKCRALTDVAFTDDTEMEEEGIAEILLDDNAIATAPRPGTSMQRPLSSANSQRPTSRGQSANRPLSSSGRPVSGYARPGTSSRPLSSAVNPNRLSTAMGGGRLNTARPVTSSGRFVRLGTASLLQRPGGEFIEVDRLNLKRYATRPALAKADVREVLSIYLLTFGHPLRALELCSVSLVESEHKDWFWKAQTGKAYYRLGLYRDAERFFLSSLKDQEMVSSYVWLSKIYQRLDRPATAMDILLKACETFPNEVTLTLAVARIHDAMNDADKAMDNYKAALTLDSYNVEAIASLASEYFYSEQPEMALRYYRRLLQMGVSSAELWNNLGLCCFHAQQYDMTLACFERALHLAQGDAAADVWYNLGQISLGIGDLGLAYQHFQIALSLNPSCAEAYNNLGVLELRKGNADQARSNLQLAAQNGPYLSEPLFNEALLSYQFGQLDESYQLIRKCTQLSPNHFECKELLESLDSHFVTHEATQLMQLEFQEELKY
ncbi:TRP protein for ciliary function [Planoprotostelium fungivorum]|uniref:TRP protein for ciliary function n=1 Tax=Planoprotostelium fungivorum TaxID=1890364 RepID=A0A2P6MUB7_9EUKA|nr:TRP protein for ciliary function [Planoprotostelium fungivorum]PRP87412.1 TRP protein for ciliary function [Planoprotostelium fungivorum]